MFSTSSLDMYNVKWLSGTRRLVWVTNGSQQVRFTDRSEEDVPLPDARFLAIHAAIAKVLYLSGAAEPLEAVMDRFDSDFESEFIPVP